MSDYDEIEKLFCGTWKFDRQENLEEILNAVEVSEEHKKLAEFKPTLTMKRNGDSIQEQMVLTPTIKYEVNLKLNEVVEWKDNEQDPKVHAKTLLTYKDGVITKDVIPQNASGGKRHFVKMSIKGGELTNEVSLPDGSSVTAKRIYKRC